MRKMRENQRRKKREVRSGEGGEEKSSICGRLGGFECLKEEQLHYHAERREGALHILLMEEHQTVFELLLQSG